MFAKDLPSPGVNGPCSGEYMVRKPGQIGTHILLLVSVYAMRNTKYCAKDMDCTMGICHLQ